MQRSDVTPVHAAIMQRSDVTPVHGNMLTNGDWTYTWDAENRLIGASNVTTVAIYAYDYMGRRIAKTVGSFTNIFVYNGWHQLRGQFPNGESRWWYNIWGLDISGSLDGAGGVGGLAVAVMDDGWGDTYPFFPSYDGNGNLTANVGPLYPARYAYDPFGNTTASGFMANNFPFRFSTKYLDEETGLYYYGYRLYSPPLGRWLSRDPLGEEAFLQAFARSRSDADQEELSEQSLQPSYLFVRNEPVQMTDWLGLNAADAVAKLLTGRAPKMWGVDISGSAVAGIGTAWGSQIGFFGDTCELGFYTVGPGVIGMKGAGVGKGIGLGLPIGLDVSISLNGSVALWKGPGFGTAASWGGLFYGGTFGGGPLAKAGVGAFWDPKKNWIGVSGGVGLSGTPISFKTNPQYYHFAGSVTVPKAVCYCAIAALP